MDPIFIIVMDLK
uniref:Uncharacterized protein n=1 Tax=Lepeophtheirus salmonis TaxID=72036 RepID=A0A0K2UY78_LEPSM